MLLKFVKIRDVESPDRGHATDAGIDFRMPKFDDKFKNDIGNNQANNGAYFEDDVIVVPPGVNIVIPSGIKVEIPFGYMGLFLNKSGIASKNDLIVGAQTIDTFYSGEVHIDLHNIGKVETILEEGQKLTQMVIMPILSCDLTEVDEDQLYDWMHEGEKRLEGGFGSTGK